MKCKVITNETEIMPEYVTISVKQQYEPLYNECYESFGWEQSASSSAKLTNEGALGLSDKAVIQYRRNREIPNKSELNELQRKCDDTLKSIAHMEREKTSLASAVSTLMGLLAVGIIGGGVFAYLDHVLWLAITQFVVGAFMLITPYVSYERIRKRITAKLQPRIDKEYENLKAICKEARSKKK